MARTRDGDVDSNATITLWYPSGKRPRVPLLWSSGGLVIHPLPDTERIMISHFQEFLTHADRIAPDEFLWFRDAEEIRADQRMRDWRASRDWTTTGAA